jgi:hypothetical protein
VPDLRIWKEAAHLFADELDPLFYDEFHQLLVAHDSTSLPTPY